MPWEQLGHCCLINRMMMVEEKIVRELIQKMDMICLRYSDQQQRCTQIMQSTNQKYETRTGQSKWPFPYPNLWNEILWRRNPAMETSGGLTFHVCNGDSRSMKKASMQRNHFAKAVQCQELPLKTTGC